MWSEVTQLCPTLCDRMDCTIPGSSVHVIFQAMVLEWVATSISRGSSQPGDRILVSHIAGRHFTVWATREALLTVWITTKCGKFLKRREYWTIYPYAGQETTVRTLHRTTDWLKIRKGEKLGCILSLYLSNFFAEYKKDLHEQDNHDGVITHLETDILECGVKWALESIITNKASRGDEFQLSYFKSWKMMLWKCCTQYAS